jgi:hypothetical protein
VILLVISASLLFLPTILSVAGVTMFGSHSPVQVTVPITTPVGVGQMKIQLS